MQTIRVASRTSELAMVQTDYVIAQLRQHRPKLQFEVVPVVTKGDKILDVTLSKVGGKGLFVSEIEAKLLTGEADIAVHSLKDVPAQLADGLQLSAYPARADARDALISSVGQTIDKLPTGAKIGTSSLRRAAQIRALRPDVEVSSVRGNINTRIRKLEEGQFDAIILASAGLERMGWQERVTEYLEADVCLPAVGQGILGIESRAEDTELNELLSALNDKTTERAALAERTLLFALNGSCQVPIAGYAIERKDGTLWLRGLVASPDGKTVLRAEAHGESPTNVGMEAAQALKKLGAAGLLEAVTADSTTEV